VSNIRQEPERNGHAYTKPDPALPEIAVRLELARRALTLTRLMAHLLFLHQRARHGSLLIRSWNPI
jgi:hypothetical protein